MAGKDTLWWDSKIKNKELANAVFGAVEDIEKDQLDLHDANERHAKLYQGYSPPGLGFGKAMRRKDYRRYQTTKNIVKSVCDTATALIGKTRPKATFTTDGGDWRVQRQAKLLDQAMVGAFHKSNIHAKWQKAFRDATIFGTGMIKLVPCDGFVDAERLLSDEIVVDEDEYMTREGDPYNIFNVKIMHKEALKSKFPDRKFKDAIDKADAQAPSKWMSYRDIKPGFCVVIEAHHRAEGGGDGRHVITVRDCVLLDEKWDYDFFPYISFHWSEPLTGFYGQGLAELLCARQLNIDKLYSFIGKAQDLILVPRVFVDAANQMMKFHLNNEIGSIIPTRGGKPPTFYTPQALTAECYNWLDTLERGGYDEAGVSMNSASNQLPKGIESAPAQREYSYKEGERFAPVSQRYEAAFIETAWKMLQFLKHIPETRKKTFRSNKFMKQIDWKKLDMENDQYEIQIQASAWDSLSPASRLQSAIELSQTGWIDRAEGRRLIAHPDLVRSDQLNNAGIERAEYVALCLTDGMAATDPEIAPNGAVEDVMENYKHVRASWAMLSQYREKDDELLAVLEEHLVYLKLCEEQLQTKPPQASTPMPPTEVGIAPTTPMNAPGPAMPQDGNMVPIINPQV